MYELSEKDMTAEFMFGEIRDACLMEIKAAGTPWQIMPQQMQDEVIERIDKNVKTVINKAVDILIAHQFPIIKGEIDKVVFKDGIQAVVKIPSGDPRRHELADARYVNIVIIDVDQFMGGGEIQSEADQRGLNIDE